MFCLLKPEKDSINICKSNCKFCIHYLLARACSDSNSIPDGFSSLGKIENFETFVITDNIQWLYRREENNIEVYLHFVTLYNDSCEDVLTNPFTVFSDEKIEPVIYFFKNDKLVWKISNPEKCEEIYSQLISGKTLVKILAEARHELFLLLSSLPWELVENRTLVNKDKDLQKFLRKATAVAKKSEGILFERNRAKGDDYLRRISRCLYPHVLFQYHSSDRKEFKIVATKYDKISDLFDSKLYRSLFRISREFP